MAIAFRITLAIVLITISTTLVNAQTIDDALIIAYELSPDLLPAEELRAEIAADLAAIRSAYPAVAEVTARPRFVPGEILVGLTPSAWAELQAGTYQGFDALNAEYGATDVEVHSSFALIVFDTPYNARLLAPIYEELEDVLYAQPNSYIGDGNDITSDAVGRYTFRRAWGDCPAGCTAQHLWMFEVTGGVALLVGESGAPVDIEKASWGKVKDLFTSSP